MFRVKRLFVCGAVIVGLLCVSTTRPQTNANRKSALSALTIEQLIEIKHPSHPVWSPDNKRVAFVWDRADIKNLYVANADGSGALVPLTSFPEGGVAEAFWSEDGESVYFVREGDFWKVPRAGGEAKPAWTKPDHGSEFALSPDARRVAFVRCWNGTGWSWRPGPMTASPPSSSNRRGSLPFT